MCLAIPGKILEINEEKHSAIVDFDGIKQEVIIVNDTIVGILTQELLVKEIFNYLKSSAN